MQFFFKLSSTCCRTIQKTEAWRCLSTSSFPHRRQRTCMWYR